MSYKDLKNAHGNPEETVLGKGPGALAERWGNVIMFPETTHRAPKVQHGRLKTPDPAPPKNKTPKNETYKTFRPNAENGKGNVQNNKTQRDVRHRWR